MKRLMIAIVAGVSLGASAVALRPNGGMPDPTVQYFQRANCHNAYDILSEDDEAGRTLSAADQAWAKAYEDAARAKQPCPEPSAELAQRAVNHVVSTENGMGHLALYLDQDDAVANFEAAMAVLGGKTTKVDPQDALAMLRKSAQLGYAPAEYLLASLHMAGTLGVPNDYAHGLPLLQAAADAGHVDALFMLGSIYHDGLGVKKDPKKALDLLGKAAERGHVYAAYLAAYMVNDGEGVKVDHDLAYRLARNLADRGEVAGAVIAASALLQMKDAKDHQDEVLYWMDVAIRDGDPKVREQIQAFRPQVVAAFKRANAPPEYHPRVRKECPMKTVCFVDHYTGRQSCTTNKDYWNDCDF